jgi:hypothetical protein
VASSRSEICAPIVLRPRAPILLYASKPLIFVLYPAKARPLTSLCGTVSVKTSTQNVSARRDPLRQAIVRPC